MAGHRKDLISVIVGMFNAAPGKDILDELELAVEASSLTLVAQSLAMSGEYKSVYADELTNAEFATLLVDNMVGSLVVAAEKEDAATFLESLLNAGDSRVDVTLTAVNALAAVPLEDAVWGAAATAFANKVDVATYYSVDAGVSSSDLATLQGVIADVDNTEASVTAKKATIDADVAKGTTFELTAGADVIEGTAKNDTINAVTSTLTTERTLDVTDQIDGGEGNDTLKVDMKSNFAGFTKDSGFLKNVETVELSNDSTIVRSFAAKEVSGVETYVLNSSGAAINLTDLANTAGVTINNQKSGTVSVGFATAAVSGTSDSWNLNLNNVGTAKATGVAQASVGVTANGLETVNLGTSGTVVASLTGTSTSALNVTGSGNAKLTGIQTGVKTVSAAGHAGVLDIDLDNASGITSFTGSEGNTTIRAAVGDFAINAKIDGGTGANVLKTAQTGTVQYEMSNVQTVELANTAALTFSAAKSSGITDIFVTKTAGAVTSTFATLGSGDVTVGLQAEIAAGTNHTVVADQSGAGAVKVVAETAGTTATHTSSDVVNFSKASSLAVDVGARTHYEGTITAGNATDLSVGIAGKTTVATVNVVKATSATINNTNTATSGVTTGTSTLVLNSPELRNLTVNNSNTFTLTPASTLSKVESLTVATAGAFTSTSALGAINSISASGSLATSKVELGALGSATLDYGISIAASGLSGGFKTTTIDTGAGQAVSINVNGMTGNAETGAIVVADQSSARTGSVTVEASSLVGELKTGAITAKAITVDANGTTGDVETGALTGDSVTINAADALGTLTITGGITAKSSVDYSGAGLQDNTLTVNATTDSTALSVALNGGIKDETITINGGAAQTSITVTGDLGIGEDELTVVGTASTIGAAATQTINISGLAGVTTSTITGNATAKNSITGGSGKDTITGGAANDTIVAGAGDDVINASAGADTMTLGTGNDTVVYTAATQTFTVVAGTNAAILAGMDRITDWGAGGTNKINLEGVAGVGTTFVAITTANQTTISEAADLAAAFDSAKDFIEAGEVGVFQYDGATYIFAQDAAPAVGASDVAIVLTGTHTLTADNFILT